MKKCYAFFIFFFTILKKNCHSHFKTCTKLALICLVTNPWKPNCVKYSLFYMHLLKNYCLDFNSEKTYKLPIALSTFDLNLVSRPNFINFVWRSKVDVYFCIFSWIISHQKNIFAIWPLHMLCILGMFMTKCLK